MQRHKDQGGHLHALASLAAQDVTAADIGVCVVGKPPGPQMGEGSENDNAPGREDTVGCHMGFESLQENIADFLQRPILHSNDCRTMSLPGRQQRREGLVG